MILTTADKMPEVNNSEMVRYRGGSALPQTKSRRLLPTSTTDSSSNSNNGGEDWITRKRVQTKTTKNIEKRVQRQVSMSMARPRFFHKIYSIIALQTERTTRFCLIDAIRIPLTMSGH